mmetsp:Transcript_77904/g.140573  ORF Transcript_77904/g.140573 Transcript_77904/m.140573 type:complete len:249 (+) Transcript_77904:792-1538(+)
MNLDDGRGGVWRRVGIFKRPRNEAEVIPPPGVLIVKVELHDRVRSRCIQGLGKHRREWFPTLSQKFQHWHLRNVEQHCAGIEHAAVGNLHLHRAAVGRRQSSHFCLKPDPGSLLCSASQHGFHEGEVANVLALSIDNLPQLIVPVFRIRIVNTGSQTQLLHRSCGDRCVDAPALRGRADLMGSEAIGSGSSDPALEESGCVPLACCSARRRKPSCQPLLPATRRKRRRCRHPQLRGHSCRPELHLRQS